MATARSGYTLPVFACAGAIAALRHLQGRGASDIALNLLTPDIDVTIPIEQVAALSATSALAITRSDPGDNLDLTRDTPIWSQVELDPSGQGETVTIAGGEGIGIQANGEGAAAIYSYARKLLLHHLDAERGDHKLRVAIILPEGRALALRTSNAAFGVVDGLSLLGTGGIAQPLSAPEQLEAFRAQLREKATRFKRLVFCIGENGLALAPTLGFPEERLVKTANWLGPLLVEAGMLGVEQVTLLGYHGKLIKLAGGIFHTHHHVADGRQEILTAIAANEGLPTPILRKLYNCPTVEAGLKLLQTEVAEGWEYIERERAAYRQREEEPPLIITRDGNRRVWLALVYHAIAECIDHRATAYIRKHCGEGAVTQVGCILFDRQRQIIVRSLEAERRS